MISIPAYFFIQENVSKKFLFRKDISEIFFSKNNCLLSVKIPRYSLNCVPLCQVIRGGILMKISLVCSQYTHIANGQTYSPLSHVLITTDILQVNWIITPARSPLDHLCKSLEARLFFFRPHYPFELFWNFSKQMKPSVEESLSYF